MFVCPSASSTLTFSSFYKLCILVTVGALEGNSCAVVWCNVNYFMQTLVLHNVNWPASCSHPHSSHCWKFVVCGVVHASPLETIQHGLPLVRGRRVLYISFMFGKQRFEAEPVVRKTLYTFLLKEVCFSFHPQRYCCITSWFFKLQGRPRAMR